METNSYWRTRCVGEAMDQGYTFLRLTCACGRITDFPFPLLLRRRGVSRQTFIGNIGFRCQNCGSTSPLVGVTSFRACFEKKVAGTLRPYSITS